ncbi:hypothetical protein MHUMG1_09336 [Metarhizium humberi]|uniref:Uncharacterized protein n=1 Tax=Metarhizium humberi TaxID=2596975 RepID=A0A9P8M348_9HYPO|nr:hypothetical protein MHUMG1_09336 [Metarhizium humberi]
MTQPARHRPRHSGSCPAWHGHVQGGIILEKVGGLEVNHNFLRRHHGPVLAPRVVRRAKRVADHNALVPHRRGAVPLGTSLRNHGRQALPSARPHRVPPCGKQLVVVVSRHPHRVRKEQLAVAGDQVEPDRRPGHVVGLSLVDNLEDAVPGKVQVEPLLALDNGGRGGVPDQTPKWLWTRASSTGMAADSSTCRDMELACPSFPRSKAPFRAYGFVVVRRGGRRLGWYSLDDDGESFACQTACLWFGGARLLWTAGDVHARRWGCSDISAHSDNG